MIKLLPNNKFESNFSIMFPCRVTASRIVAPLNKLVRVILVFDYARRINY